MNVLVYLDKNEIIRHGGRGGPLGVGYYIYKEAKRRGLENIHFLNENVEYCDENTVTQTSVKDRIPKAIRSALGIGKRYFLFRSRIYNPQFIKNIDFDRYDIIHFHDTESMYNARLNLENYKGIVILTSHSPVPYAQEKASEMLTAFEYRVFYNLYKHLEDFDEYAFLRADYILFPCVEAEEPYFNNWKKYEKIHSKKADKYRYVPTGIEKKTAAVSKKDIRDKYGLSNEDFIISFTGRHNSVKGYDILKETAARLFAIDDKYKVIAAGKEDPIKRLEHRNWKEIGYTKDPYSIVAASDVYFLPNRETYFDLVAIEVLSLGKILVASRTGGNKYFEKMGVKGVLLYDNLDEAIQIIERVKNMSSSERLELEMSNLEFYKAHLTERAYFDGYYNVLQDIFENSFSELEE